MEPTIDIPDNLRFVHWSDERRPVHLEETIAHALDPDAMWVFEYDSLIWDPRFKPLEARISSLTLIVARSASGRRLVVVLRSSRAWA